MKKLIGLSLVALLAITAANTAEAQIVKIKDGKVKIKDDLSGGKIKDKDGFYKVKGGVLPDETYSSYTTVKNKPNKYKVKATRSRSYAYAVAKNKPGKHKVKATSSVRYTTVKSKKGKYKVKPDQYAMAKSKSKDGKHKVKL